MNAKTLRRMKAESGFTLLEVLISIVVIAFGLLGIAGLQAFALQNNQSAGQRMTTTMLANDMVERVWSSNPNFRPLYDAPSISSYSSADPNCLSVGGCPAAQLVANDLAEWQDQIKRSLPGGEGIICRDDSPDDGDNAAAPQCSGGATNPFVVKIWWLDDRSTTAVAGKPQRFSWSFNP